MGWELCVEALVSQYPVGVPRQALYRLNQRLSSKGERSEVEQAVTAGNPVIRWLNSFLSLVSH